MYIFIVAASLYNNWGLLYQEKQEYAKSADTLQKALFVIRQVSNSAIKEAITKTNLANSLLGVQTEETVEKGYTYVTEALAVFVEDGEKDFHYGAALVAMGDYLVHKSQWKQAKKYYKKGLVEILIHTGKTEFYHRVVEKYENVIAKLQPSEKWKNNLVRSREFYEQYGKTMIHTLFPDYEARIAVGMVGEGSDCFGFDDEISMDHDYAVGFCMWLTKEDMQVIGSELQEAYHNLVMNVEREATCVHKEGSQNPILLDSQIPNVRFTTECSENICFNSKVYASNMARLNNRRGVFEIDAFYRADVEEYKLAELVNGEVFRDDLGLFTEKRNTLLAYYPEELWRKKLANCLHEFSQYGQANYARMMTREDYVTANLCISKAMESAMDIAYVLNKKYAPYYKWKRKGLEQLGESKDILWICEQLSLLSCQKKAWENKTYDSREINTDDKCVVLLETLAGIILEEMKVRKLVEGTDVFLETYIEQILA